MTDPKPSPKSFALVAQIDALLDRSRAGADAAEALEAAYVEAQQERTGLSKDDSAQVEQQIRFHIESEKARLRDALLTRIGAVLEEIRAERGADVVVDASSVIAVRADADITAEALRRLDAMGAAPASGAPRRSTSPSPPRRGRH